MRINKTFISLLMYTILPSVLLAQENIAKKINWTVAAKLPPAPGLEKQLGLAGVFTGVSNGVLLIAGGAYFPDKKPWEGGKKAHTSQVFVLEKQGDDFGWINTEINLKNKTAYGASITTSDGVFCAGGETETTNSSREAFIMKWNPVKKQVDFHDLPWLPIPLVNACITAIDKKIYIIGGETNGKPSGKAFMLDMALAHLKWQALPDMPLAMSHSVAVTQSNGNYPCVYVIGGRSSTVSGVSELHDKTFCYNPSEQKWVTLNNIGDGIHTTNLSAATGVAIGADHILIIGGDKGDIFHRIERYNYEIERAMTSEEKRKLQDEKLQLITHHPGFSRDILLYNTLTDTWQKVGQLPFYGHVTTTAIKWDNDIFIPAGEIMPGIRTPDILKGEILNDIK